MELDVLGMDAATEVGNYFVSNYPPFSVWSGGEVPRAIGALDSSPTVKTPVGLYIHIPFCRKRCTFCYFRVYTDKNSRDVRTYLSAIAREAAWYAEREGLSGRSPDFAYFGGGTPSYLSSDQLRRLVDRLDRRWSWDRAREVTFECEPGTLRKSKLEAIRSIGTSRLSLGIEHFDDAVLELNGRAHRSAEVYRAYQEAREVGFEQINVDLIAGMVGDDEAGWNRTVDQALALKPDSVTIYQMEVPHNTVIARNVRSTGTSPPVADWPTKRRWVDDAFRRFEAESYVVSSGYTLVRPAPRAAFVYRDALWHGGDMIGLGVASFSHFQGVHFQNVDSWEDYLSKVEGGGAPLARAMVTEPDQRMTRELILQLKLGRIKRDYFTAKYGIDPRVRFADEWRGLVQEGWAEEDGDLMTLTRAGLLRVDGLLPRFFEPQFRRIRYT